MGGVPGRPPVILGITGTARPFPRLVSALAQWAAAHPAEQVWVQHGSSEKPATLGGTAFVSRQELLAKMGTADAIVCHGGSGTLFDALSVGHVPVVMPRRAHLGEHVNDHQLEITRALAAEGRIIPAADFPDLGDAIAKSRKARRALVGSGNDGLVKAIEQAVRLTARKQFRTQPVLALLRIATWWVPIRQADAPP